MKYYDQEYYGREVVYADRRRFFSLDRVDDARLNRIEKLTGRVGSMLDIGCGSGRFLRAAAARGWDCFGIEGNEGMVEQAKRCSGISVRQGDINDLSTCGRFFDVVTLWGVLEHAHEPVGLLRACCSMLADGGVLVTLVPNVASRQSVMFGSHWQLLDVPVHLTHFSETTLVAAMRESGFASIGTRYFAIEHDPGSLTRSAKALGKSLLGHRDFGRTAVASPSVAMASISSGVVRPVRYVAALVASYLLALNGRSVALEAMWSRESDSSADG